MSSGEPIPKLKNIFMNLLPRFRFSSGLACLRSFDARGRSVVVRPHAFAETKGEHARLTPRLFLVFRFFPLEHSRPSKKCVRTIRTRAPKAGPGEFCVRLRSTVSRCVRSERIDGRSENEYHRTNQQRLRVVRLTSATQQNGLTLRRRLSTFTGLNSGPASALGVQSKSGATKARSHKGP